MGVGRNWGQTITERNGNRVAELVSRSVWSKILGQSVDSLQNGRFQVPFLDQLFYVGPLVQPLGGAGVSWIAGFGLASLLYLAGAKRFVGVRPGVAAAVGTAA